MKSDLSIQDVVLNADNLFYRLRFPDGLECPYCHEKHIWTLKDGWFKCSHCNKRFSLTSSTIFHRSHLSKVHIMMTLYYISVSRGISSLQLSLLLKINRNTSFMLLHKVRSVLNQDSIRLFNEVAIDEVYLKGKWSSIHNDKKRALLKKFGLYFEGDKKRTYSNVNIKRCISRFKQPVMGFNDGTNIILRCLPNRFTEADIINMFNEHCSGAESVVSDCSSLYNNIEKKTGKPITMSNHSKYKFIEKGKSSNRIEGTFSHLKRRIRHNYVRPDKRLMQLYLNEMVFRWNNRNNSTYNTLANIFIFVNKSSPLTYKDFYAYKSAEQRPYKKLEDPSKFPWNDAISSIIIDGVEYKNPRYNK